MSHYDAERELENFKQDRPSWAKVLLQSKYLMNGFAWAESYTDYVKAVNAAGGTFRLETSCWEIVEEFDEPPLPEQKPDLVNSPNHYMFFDTEAIKVIRNSMTAEEFKGYCKGNALKYRLRAGKKDATEQEIAKAEKYESLYEEYKDGA